jgi:hypothetical protein
MEYHEELNISGISSHNGLVASSRFRIWQCQPTVSKEDITETKWIGLSSLEAVEFRLKLSIAPNEPDILSFFSKY